MPGCSAGALKAGSSRATITSRDFLIPPFIAPHPSVLPGEFDAEGLATAPNHFAFPPRAGIACKRQLQFGRQRVAIVDRDLRRRALNDRKKEVSNGLPGRPNATIRSPVAALI